MRPVAFGSGENVQAGRWEAAAPLSQVHQSV